MNTFMCDHGVLYGNPCGSCLSYDPDYWYPDDSLLVADEETWDLDGFNEAAWKLLESFDHGVVEMEVDENYDL